MVKKKIKLKNNDLGSNLVLPRYIAYLLGYNNISNIFNDLKNSDDAYYSDINSYYETILSRENRIIKDNELEDYNDNIKNYVNKVKRSDNFKLKYYQYLAVLFNEIFLDKYFSDTTSRKMKFMMELNNYIDENNLNHEYYYTYQEFLKNPKIAYWMATGSGKTIIMHINYLQFIYYNKKYNNAIKIDNYILITPSEYLTKQHLEEFNKSGVSAIQFSVNSLENFSNPIKVIDINKLTDDKKGSGVSIDINLFGSHNLIIVDEGHKGYKSDENKKWLNIRNRLSEDGFTYEYSATFGQALSTDNDLIEYSRAIIFDYSYKYFYTDGYGKEFFVINTDPNKFDESKQRNIMLLANAISYAEQIYIYNKYKGDMGYYNIEKPLWMFVGSKVNITGKRIDSDIYSVIDFMQWVIDSDREIIINYIENILTGKSGIIDENGNDVFGKLYDENLFKFFRERILKNEMNIENIYNIIFNDVLRNESGSKIIYLSKIKNAAGEIGLSIGDENNYFGLIDIGDRETFIKNMKIKNIKIVEDNFTKSLFENINKPNDINIIIGAKKFIEGWDTYRASTFSLMYIGRSEGSQIIQLFGRGIRLKGINNSLKRSDIDDKKINTVQTLYIYGIKADYLATFRDIISKEDSLYISTKIETTKEVFKTAPDLPVLKENVDKNKFNSMLLELQDINTKLSLDLIPKAIRIESRESTLNDTIDLKPYKIEKDVLDVIDWNNLYLSLLEFKCEKKYYNIIIDINKIMDFIYNGKYDLYIPIYTIDKNNFDYIKYISNIIEELSKKFIKQNYNKYYSENIEMKLENIGENDILNEYNVYIKESLAKTIDINNENSIILKNYKILEKIGGIRTVNSKISLYKPLFIISKNEVVKTVPEGLNDGENNLINDLCNYISGNYDLLNNYSFYLLRNGIKGKGIGFFVNGQWIYPDFILWAINSSECKITFLEPHGLYHADLDEDPKLNLYNYLKRLDLNSLKKNINYNQLTLDSFVISVTEYKYLTSSKPEIKNIHLDELASDKHILFQKIDDDNYNHNYINDMFNLIFT
jgi:hypothetical protein